MSKLTGAETVVECLKEQGVGTVSGLPGDTILNIYDAPYRHQDEITHILASHERGASHATDGYARATGKAGVYMVTSGLGTTSLVTNIATTYMDSAPMVTITCNVTNSLLGKDSFQETDIVDVTMPIIKCNFIVKGVRRLVTVIRRAFTIAQIGRPGPALVSIIKDTTAVAYGYEKEVPKEVMRQSDIIREEDMERTVGTIRKPREPFTLVDGGVILSNTSNELGAFVHKIQAPMAGSLMGKGAFGGRDGLYTGMVGMHGARAFSLDIIGVDLLIVVSAGLSDRVTGNASKFARNAKILQLDINPAEVNKNIKVDTSVIGDVKVTLHKLNARLNPINHDERIAHIERMKDMYPLRYDRSTPTGPFIVQAINEVAQEGVVTVTEVGQHQMWATQYYDHRQPRTFLISGGLEIMGHGLGTAIEAKMECRGKTVINITGGGCFRTDMNETATATRYNIPVVGVVVNSHVLGTVRQWQVLSHGKRYSQIIPNDGVGFIKVVEAMGTKTYGIAQREELEPALGEAISLNVSVVIDYQISCDEKVFLMISPGAPIADAFDDMDLKIN